MLKKVKRSVTEMVAKVLETHWGPVLEEARFSLPPEASSKDSEKMLDTQ